MNIKALISGTLLVFLAATAVRADGTPAWQRDNQLTIGFALGKGFVDRSGSEIAAFQYRVEFRRQRVYVAYRGSWVAQECNSRPNPREAALLAGLTLPLGSGSGRNRLNFGLGISKTSLYGAPHGWPCEVRLKHDVLGLTVFSNFNKRHSFHGVCASFDFPLRIFNR